VKRWVVFLSIVLLGACLCAVTAKRLGLRSKASRILTRYFKPPRVVAIPLPFTRPDRSSMAETIYDGGIKGQWQDWGWAPHEQLEKKGPLRIDLSNWGGWQLVRWGLDGDYEAVTFRYRAPEGFGEFLQVFLGDAQDRRFPHVNVTGAYQTKAADGFWDVYIPLNHLNPKEAPFERITLFVTKPVSRDWVLIDRLGFTSPPDPSTLPVSNENTELAVRCDSVPRQISPNIYGIAADLLNYKKNQGQWDIGATIRRWGGNPASRYNWELGNAWNTGSDWFFENVDYTGVKQPAYELFLADNELHGLESALTVPIIGWVAKDTRSNGFPRMLYPKQASFDQWRSEAGNGIGDGHPIPAGHPSLTSVPAPSEFIRRWVMSIRKRDAQLGHRSVRQYILDNEPNLWNSTHRDVHPKPTSYDELLGRTIDYAMAIRDADPDAIIAGPAEWGWTNYFYSAADGASQFGLHADRLSHGNAPLIEWYLDKLREHEQRTGKRAIDVLDLHFYPQAKGVYSEKENPKLAALRIRSTRGLWDSSYKDESWIAEPIQLIPRMQEWVKSHYPGLGISIGEWSFGGERYMSGALAIAEALGHFGRLGLASAFYWTQPSTNLPGFWAFRAYRNFDGAGAKFDSLSIDTASAPGLSLFASRNPDETRYVLVALNFQRTKRVAARVRLQGCPNPDRIRAFEYTGGETGFAKSKCDLTGGSLTLVLEPYSISVIELTRDIGVPHH
jgi:hypothetical protein